MHSKTNHYKLNQYNNINQRLASYIIKLLIVFFLLTPVAQAGTLDDFEEGLGKPSPSRNNGSRNTSSTDDDDSDDGILGSCLSDIFQEVFVKAITLPFVLGAKYSYARIDPLNADSVFEDIEILPREKGDALIPIVDARLSYQYLDSDMAAFKADLELGYASFGIRSSFSRYFETLENGSTDTMNTMQAHGLLRFSAGDHAEIDLGLGHYKISGNKDHSGFSVTIPMRFQIIKQMGLEYKPVWAFINNTTVRDTELSASFRHKQFSLHGGYKWLEHPGQTIKGPFAGLSFSF